MVRSDSCSDMGHSGSSGDYFDSQCCKGCKDHFVGHSAAHSGMGMVPEQERFEKELVRSGTAVMSDLVEAELACSC